MSQTTKQEELRILRLPIEGQWFDMIMTKANLDPKTTEYRKIGKYWAQRLLIKGTYRILGNGQLQAIKFPYLKLFDVVELKNGYSANARKGYVEFKNTYIGQGKKEWGAEEGVKYFCIDLGPIIEDLETYAKEIGKVIKKKPQTST